MNPKKLLVPTVEEETDETPGGREFKTKLKKVGHLLSNDRDKYAIQESESIKDIEETVQFLLHQRALQVNIQVHQVEKELWHSVFRFWKSSKAKSTCHYYKRRHFFL